LLEIGIRYGMPPHEARSKDVPLWELAGLAPHASAMLLQTSSFATVADKYGVQPVKVGVALQWAEDDAAVNRQLGDECAVVHLDQGAGDSVRLGPFVQCKNSPITSSRVSALVARISQPFVVTRLSWNVDAQTYWPRHRITKMTVAARSRSAILNELGRLELRYGAHFDVTAPTQESYSFWKEANRIAITYVLAAIGALTVAGSYWIRSIKIDLKAEVFLRRMLGQSDRHIARLLRIDMAIQNSCVCALALTCCLLGRYIIGMQFSSVFPAVIAICVFGSVALPTFLGVSLLLKEEPVEGSKS
jgi:hypothetical protein